MNIGVVGLGRVGLALALVLRHHGRHNVIGYDKDEARVRQTQEQHAQDEKVHPERALRDLLAILPIPQAPSMASLVHYADVVILMVDTPHPPTFDTTDTLPSMRQDFDYSNLRSAVTDFMLQATLQRKQLTLIISSTVSPGTTLALTNGHPENVRVGYSPVLISLGTVVRDLLDPEVILAGAENRDQAVHDTIQAIWTPVVNTAPVARLSLVEAEIAKLSMNAFMSAKISFANAVCELTDEYGGDFDRVAHVWSHCRAMTSMQLMKAGLGDGGPCRPRDVAVLETISNNRELRSADLWRALTEARESHAWWLAEKIEFLAVQHQDLPVVLCGIAYKPGVPYVDGSPALLIQQYLSRLDVPVLCWDPATDWQTAPPDRALFVITGRSFEFAQRHSSWTRPAPGSIVFDPWGSVAGQWPGVAVIKPGRDT